MSKGIVVAGLALLGLGGAANAAWINEIHYDNTGGDAGEFVEIVLAPGETAADFTVTLYNGSGGASYNSVAVSTFTAGATVSGYQFYWALIAGIQNGAPDGIALDDNGSLVEFLSYEGDFAATDGVANGILSTDIGVAETSSTPIGASLGLTGSGSSAGDFTWAVFDGGVTGPGLETPGGLNFGQSLVPAPGALALLALGLVARRRRRHG